MNDKPQNKQTKQRRILIGAVSAVIVAAGFYAFSQTPLYARLTDTRLVYSQSALLNETWSTYKADHIESGSNRTLDSHVSNITSSRSQSDTLLRSVWIDDKATFDASWKWSMQTAQLENKLFISSYGPHSDKTYGAIDTTTDSAADTNTALSLLMAYSRWNDPAYLTDAEAIIGSLYDNSVVTVNGSPIMLASSADIDTTAFTVSPDTFTTNAYKEFAKVDPSHDWTGLVNSSYDTLNRMVAQNDGVLPNAATIDRATGTITMNQDAKVFTSRSATGVWNLGLDYAWNKDARTLDLMKKLTLSTQYAKTGKILTGAGESAATYGKLIGYFKAVDPAQAESVFTNKITNHYNQDIQTWGSNLSFEDQTWLWFGAALYNGQLHQLTEDAS